MTAGIDDTSEFRGFTLPLTSIVRRFIKLGVKAKSAWRRIYEGRKSWWALSHTSVVDRGLRNAYFAERGLVSLEKRWEDFQARAIVAVPTPAHAGAGIAAVATPSPGYEDSLGPRCPEEPDVRSTSPVL